MIARLLRIVVVVAVLGVVGGLLFWAWEEGQGERARQETRELSIKEPPRRVKNPATGDWMIRLDADAQERLGLVLEPAKAARRQKTLKLLGFSVTVPHRVAEVRSPWTGIVESPADSPMPIVGQQVRKGQSLGTLLVQWSPSDRIQLENQLQDAKGIIGETDAELEVTRNAVERLRKISDGAVAGKQLLEAEGTLAKLDARLTAARARERALEDALAKKESQMRFSLTAAQDGQLTEIHSRPGEVISAGSLVATIYDPRELWVTVLALPRQLNPSSVPHEAEVTFPGFESQPITAQLVRLKPQVERQQQALELVYAATNPDSHIPVGLQAEVRAKIGEPMDVLSVPRSAVLQMNDQRLVYVQTAPEQFAKRSVQVEDEDAERVFLRANSDLPPEAAVVVRGAQVLLSEEYKESIQLVEEGGKRD